MRPDGSECKVIFGGPIENVPGVSDCMTLYREPHWTWQSPNGKYFASWATESFRPRDKAQSRPIYSLHLGRTNGVGPTRIIAPDCAEAVAWSPDSKRLAFAVFSRDAERSTGSDVP